MSSLPSGWVAAKLSELAEINPPKDQIEIPPDMPMAFVPMASVKEEFGGINVSGARPFDQVRKGYVQFRARDVLFAKITPCMENGKVGVVPKLESPVGYGSTEFHIVRTPAAVDPRWVAHFLSQEEFRRVARRNMSGSAGQLRVPEAWLSEQSIPVAPSREQQRIVEKLEELVTDLDAGVAALERARANLKRYRAAVLKAAMEGRLTAKWRAAHPDVEPASKLLGRILAERRKKWEEEQLKKYADKGQAPPKGWKDKYPEPVRPDVAELPKLPEGWCWATLDQLAEIGTGATPLRSEPRYWTGGTIPWVTSAVVNAPLVREASEFVTVAALAETNLFLYPVNTLVLAMYGEGKTRGKVSELLLEATTNQALAALVLSDSSSACRPYVKAFLAKSYEVMRRVASGGVQPNLNLGLIREMRVPLPPLDEQAEISMAIERLLSVQERLVQESEKSAIRSGHLRQSILKSAFEGKLVPQDPKDEPAGELLARIREGRSVSDPKQGKRAAGRRRGAGR